MSDIRCEVTELLADQCGCRRHRGGQTPQEEADAGTAPGPWFRAQFFGDCTRHGGRFAPTELIRADGHGGWECCE